MKLAFLYGCILLQILIFFPSSVLAACDPPECSSDSECGGAPYRCQANCCVDTTPPTCGNDRQGACNGGDCNIIDSGTRNVCNDCGCHSEACTPPCPTIIPRPCTDSDCYTGVPQSCSQLGGTCTGTYPSCTCNLPPPDQCLTIDDCPPTLNGCPIAGCTGLPRKCDYRCDLPNCPNGPGAHCNNPGVCADTCSSCQYGSNGSYCNQCSPNCTGKSCGPDGCGGSCGPCLSPNVCNETAGQCVSPYCSTENQRNCVYGCNPDVNGGTCLSSPTCTDTCGMCTSYSEPFNCGWGSAICADCYTGENYSSACYLGDCPATPVVGSCVNAGARCLNNHVQVCVNGGWVDQTDCTASGSMICAQGNCTPSKCRAFGTFPELSVMERRDGYLCDFGGVIKQELDKTLDYASGTIRCGNFGAQGRDSDYCNYTCKVSNGALMWVKDKADCPNNRACLFDKDVMKDEWGCTYSCVDNQWVVDGGCVCVSGSSVNKTPYISIRCQNNQVNHLSCMDGSLVTSDETGKILNIQTCPGGSCYHGQCVPEKQVCEGDVLYKMNPDGTKTELDICASGCVSGTGSGYCRIPYVGYCDTDRPQLLPDGCKYTCAYSLFEGKQDSRIYWHKIDPSCHTDYEMDYECTGNDVYKNTYDFVNGKVSRIKSEFVKSCPEKCASGECASISPFNCPPGSTQYDDRGNLMECVNICNEYGLECYNGFQKADFGISISLDPGMSNYNRQQFYKTLIDLRNANTGFLNNKNLLYIVNSAFYAFTGSPDTYSLKGTITSYIDYYYKNIYLRTDMEGLPIPNVMAHELAHSLLPQNSPVMSNWAKTMGWTTPDPTGTGIKYVSPGNLPSGYGSLSPGEDFAESVAMYYTDSCKLLRTSEGRLRYNFLKDPANNIFNNHEFLPAGGCPITLWENLQMKIMAISSDVNVKLNKLNLGIRPILALTPVFRADQFNSFTVGQSTKQQVLSALGTPTAQSDKLFQDRLFYLAEDGISYQTLIFENDILKFITLHLYPNTENLSNYGTYDKETYNYYRADTKTFFYPSQGLALTADEEGKILVKQKFEPTSITTFTNKYGSDFPEKSPVDTPRLDRSKRFSAGDVDFSGAVDVRDLKWVIGGFNDFSMYNNVVSNYGR